MGARKTPSIAGKQTIRYSGLYDFDTLYAAVVNWAKNYGYMWNEKTYKHKIPGPLGAEQELDWDLTKNVTSFFRYTIAIRIHTYEMKEVIVNIGGKEKSLTSGRIYFVLDGTIHWDWQGYFSGTPFREKLGDWLTTLLIKDISSIHWDVLTYRVLNLHNVIKKNLDMQTKKYEYKTYLKES